MLALEQELNALLGGGDAVQQMLADPAALGAAEAFLAATDEGGPGEATMPGFDPLPSESSQKGGAGEGSTAEAVYL